MQDRINIIGALYMDAWSLKNILYRVRDFSQTLFNECENGEEIAKGDVCWILYAVESILAYIEEHPSKYNVLGDENKFIGEIMRYATLTVRKSDYEEDNFKALMKQMQDIVEQWGEINSKHYAAQ